MMNAKNIGFHKLLIILFLFPFVSRSQNNIRWGALNKDGRRINLDLQYAGKEKTGNTIWLKKNKEGYFLEKFDGQNIRFFSKKINYDSLLPSAQRKTIQCYPIFFANERLDVFVQYNDKKTKLTFTALVQITTDGQVMSCQAPLFVPDKYSYHKFSVSPDSSLFGVAQIVTEKKENRVILKTFDRSLRPVNEFKTSIDPPDNEKVMEVAMHNIVIDNAGNFLLEGFLQNKNYNPVGTAYWLVKPIENDVKSMVPGLPGAVVETSEIVCNAYGIFEIAGIAQKANTKTAASDNHLLFFGRVDLANQAIEVLKVSPFKMPHFKAEDYGEYYSTNTSTAILKNDGGIILLVEQLIFGKKNLWVHVNDVFVANFNPDGHVNYFKQVEKKQGYLFGPYLPAYSTLPVYDQYSGTLHLIFNVNEEVAIAGGLKSMRSAKRSIPVIVAIGESGKMTKKQLGPPASHRVVLCPMWSHQLSSNEVVVGGLESKGYRIGRIDVNGVTGKYLSDRRYYYYHTRAKPRYHRSRNHDDSFFIGGFTGGISSPPNATYLNWLNKNGYGANYNAVNQDLGLFYLYGAAKGGGGLEFSHSEGALYSPEINPRFAKTRFGYVFAKPLVATSTTRSFFCLGIGFSVCFFDFKQTVFPQVSTQPADFSIGFTSLLINPSYRVYRCVAKSGLITGFDVGARLNLFPGNGIMMMPGTRMLYSTECLAFQLLISTSTSLSRSCPGELASGGDADHE